MIEQKKNERKREKKETKYESMNQLENGIKIKEQQLNWKQQT